MSSESVGHKTNELGRRLIAIGGILIGISVSIILFTFYPVLKEELSYQLRKTQRTVNIVDQNGQAYGPHQEVLEPVNTEFSILIPKIAARAPIIANVDPNNAEVYQRKLTQGVAHAAGSTLPGKVGNTFLFAHSAGNFYEANRYNAVFYLLRKLEKGDEIAVYFEGDKLQYRVTDTHIVEPDAVEFLSKSADKDKLTLMTCWPPGTTMKRLIVQAERE